MDDQEFHRRADQALEALNHRLAAAADRYEFESDFNAGALTIEFDDPPARFVVSPNSPVRQVWVSALTRSFKLDWSDSRNAFVLPETNQTLTELIQSAIAQHTGVEVAL
jgi:CyaY protein